MTLTRHIPRLPCGLGLLLAVCAAPRAQTMMWSQKSPAVSPTARRLMAMAFDSARGRSVLYGGFDGATGLADTWEWDGTSWMQPVTAANPGRLQEHAMAFDAARNRTVLFGGLRTGVGVLSETWEWDGTSWLRRNPTRVPPGRTGAAMTFDSIRGHVLMFGGLGRTGDPPERNDLWAWDGSEWTQILTAVTPARRHSAAMAFDSGRGRMVLFGGFSNLDGILGDTWEWDGMQWLLQPSGLVPGRWRAGMVFDPARRRTVLFGGLRGSSLSDTWEWDGVTWQRMPVTGPPARNSFGMAMDSRRGRAALFGGGMGATDVRRDTWEYQPADVDPPVVAITAPADGAILGSDQVAVTGTVSDMSATNVASTPAGIATALPAGGGAVAGTVTFVDPDGPQTLSLRATDTAGNSGGHSVSVLLDRTAPQVSIAAPAEGLVLGDSPVRFSVVVTDLTATTVRFGGHMIPLPAGGGTATGDVALLEGSNTIQILVTDAAGHETRLSRTVRLDSTAPLVGITSPADGARFGQGMSMIPVVATVDDASPTLVSSVPAGVAAELPAGGGLAVGTVPLQEGANEIRVTAQDSLGRGASASVAVWLDTVSPSVTWSAPAADALVRGTIELLVLAQDPAPGLGMSRVELMLDGAPLMTLESAPFGTTLDTAAIADGSHLLRAVAFDLLGNQSEAMVRFDVDNTPPALRFLTPAPMAQVFGLLDFEFAAADSGAGLSEVTITVGGLRPTGDASATYAPPVGADTRRGQEDTLRWPNGPLTFVLRATDAAGNPAETELTVQVDNSQPPLPAITPGDGTRVRGEITIVANATGDDLRRIELFVDGVPVGRSGTSPLRVRFDTRNRLDGAMEIRSVTTGSGDRTASASVQVTVDNMRIRRVTPEGLLLRVPHARLPLRVEVEGGNVELLRAVPHQRVELRVPGGRPVLAAPTTRHQGRGWRNDRDQLQLEFDRRDVILAILAGMDGNQIRRDARRVAVTLWAAGKEIGTAHVHFSGHHGGQ